MIGLVALLSCFLPYIVISLRFGGDFIIVMGKGKKGARGKGARGKGAIIKQLINQTTNLQITKTGYDRGAS
jgi:hypothetical protein